jgi:hypothetical protein
MGGAIALNVARRCPVGNVMMVAATDSKEQEEPKTIKDVSPNSTDTLSGDGDGGGGGATLSSAPPAQAPAASPPAAAATSSSSSSLPAVATLVLCAPMLGIPEVIRGEGRWKRGQVSKVWVLVIS